MRMVPRPLWSAMDGRRSNWCLYSNSIKCIVRSVCACGKWVCTSNRCPEKHDQDLTNIEDITNTLETEEDSEEYYDEEEEEEDPEDDPDVQDISWF